MSSNDPTRDPSLWERATAMAAGRNKRLARRALEDIYAKADVQLADELIHRDFVDHEPAHPDLPTGPDGVKQTVRGLHDVFGELRFDVEHEIAEADTVVQIVTMSGRHTGRLMGRAPTGRPFSVRHISIWRIADDKIVEHWGSRDDLGLLTQLGLVSINALGSVARRGRVARVCRDHGEPAPRSPGWRNARRFGGGLHAARLLASSSGPTTMLRSADARERVADEHVDDAAAA